MGAARPRQPERQCQGLRHQPGGQAVAGVSAGKIQRTHPQLWITRLLGVSWPWVPGEGCPLCDTLQLGPEDWAQVCVRVGGGSAAQLQRIPRLLPGPVRPARLLDKTITSAANRLIRDCTTGCGTDGSFYS